MNIIGNRLKKAIFEAGYKSIRQFSEICGISRTTISQICNDKYPFSISEYTMSQLCKYSHVTPEYLTGTELIYPEQETKEEKAERLLFDLFVTIGRIEPLEEGSNLYRLYGNSKQLDWYTNNGPDNIEMSGEELKNLLYFFQEKLENMVDEYMKLCSIHNRDAFLKKWLNEALKERQELFDNT